MSCQHGMEEGAERCVYVCGVHSSLYFFGNTVELCKEIKPVS